jgi:universal stress protein A
VRIGLPQEEIVRAAGENNIDLIIIGRHGRTGLARLLLGGTAEHVLRHAPCPALVVRERERDFIAGGRRMPMHAVS